MTKASPVKFGTDGWRGVIADDFTFENVRVAAAAIANYVLDKEDGKTGICIGYDTRFGSRAFALAVAKVVAGAGIPIWMADRVTPTPAVSFAVRHLGCAGGVMITSSHNPYQWNGVKFKASYGGSARPAIVAEVETRLGKPLPQAEHEAGIAETDFQTPYVAALRQFADLPKIAASGFRFAIDCMYGAGRGVLAGLFQEVGVSFVEIRSEANPLFPGINPEPIEPHIRALQETVIEHKCDAGLVTDGDADRIGAVDEHGTFVDPNKIFALVLRWILERKHWPGDVTRACNTTSMLDRICAKYGRKLHEHGIGFKYVCDLMLDKDILMGGEEAGGIGIKRHLPERDGLLMALLIANVMADEGKTLGELVASLQQEFGEHQYDRLDLHIDDTLKKAAIHRAHSGVKEFAGMPVLRVVTIDGIKFFLDNPEAKSRLNAAETWLMMRASGAEPLLRIYCESCSRESVAKLLEAARQFAMSSSSTGPAIAIGR